MTIQKILKTAKEKLTSIILAALIASLTTFFVTVKSKLYFAWHSEHYFEMVFEKFRSMQDNRDGTDLYVIMENEVSGEVLYIVDILETTEGVKWAFIYDIWIFYPVREDDHGRMYVNMEHEGNKYLFLRK